MANSILFVQEKIIYFQKYQNVKNSQNCFVRISGILFRESEIHLIRLIICLLYVYIGLFILFRMVHLICLTLHREIVVCWKSFIFILYLYSQYIFFTELAQSCSHKTSEQVVCLALSEAVEYASWKIGGCSPLRSLYYTVYFPSAVGYYSHSLERVFFMSITHKNFQQAKF